MPIREALMRLWQPLDQEQLALSFMIAWQIWKSRCSNIFENKKPKPDRTLIATDSLLQAIKSTRYSFSHPQTVAVPGLQFAMLTGRSSHLTWEGQPI